MKFPDENYNNSSVGYVKSIGFNTSKGVFKSRNEDRICVILEVERPKDYKKTWPKISYFALFDGHNGREVASFLKENLHKYIFNQEAFPENPYIAISNAFREVQGLIEEKLKNFSLNNSFLSNISHTSSENNIKTTSSKYLGNLSFNNKISTNDTQGNNNKNGSVNPLMFCGSTVAILLIIGNIFNYIIIFVKLITYYLTISLK